jgi:hypothetical protein
MESDLYALRVRALSCTITELAHFVKRRGKMCKNNFTLLVLPKSVAQAFRLKRRDREIKRLRD